MSMFTNLHKDEKEKQKKLDIVSEAFYQGLNLVDDDPNRQLYEREEEDAE